MHPVPTPTPPAQATAPATPPYPFSSPLTTCPAPHPLPCAGDGTGRPTAAVEAGRGGHTPKKDKAEGRHDNKRSDRAGFSKAELSRIKRGGVGKKAFKSKKKFQRKK